MKYDESTLIQHMKKFPNITFEIENTDKIKSDTKIIVYCKTHDMVTTKTLKTLLKCKTPCRKCSYTGAGKIDYTGRVYNTCHGKYMVVKTLESRRVKCFNLDRLTDNFELSVDYLRSGKDFKDPYKPFEGMPCYRGVGIHDSKKHPSIWNRWYKMHERCYKVDSTPKHNRLNYEGCRVSEDWYNFQNYAEWFLKNMPKGLTLKDVDVDKDILFEGNKLYSPNTCCIVPSCINVALTFRSNDRGKLPLGIYYKKKNNKYCVQCSTGGKGGKQKYLGLFDNIDVAFNAYKGFKENVIHSLAEKYKNSISRDVYVILSNWEVNKKFNKQTGEIVEVANE